jgi:hypothetical protein
MDTRAWAYSSAPHSAWQQGNPARTTVLVFVTDSLPTECGTDLSDIEEVVGEYFVGAQGVYNTVGQPHIRTFISEPSSYCRSTAAALSKLRRPRGVPESVDVQL